MNPLGVGLFCVGALVSMGFAARAVIPEDPKAKITSSQRLADWWNLAGIPFSAGALLMFAGGILARRKSHAIAPGAKIGSGRPAKELIGEIEKKLAQAKALDPTAEEKTLHELLDSILEVEVVEFLEQRKPLIDEMGLNRFAQMIGSFAAMERNTARAWSALTDGVPSEVPACLERAEQGIAEAVKFFES